MSKKNSPVNIINHPVLRHKLTLLRKKETSPADFRRILTEISCLLAYEVTRDLELKQIPIETPLEKTSQPMIARPPLIVSIQRAGSGMLDGILQTLPFARVGHIGIYRDKFIRNTVEYYFRIPNDAEGDNVILIDPLLATGDTAVNAIDRLKAYKVGPIKFLCVLSAPDGIKKIHHFHPDVEIWTAHTDRELSPKGYILPGLGDAGDRLFDTV
jgi:uracil phosphoribosyltransferase